MLRSVSTALKARGAGARCMLALAVLAGLAGVAAQGYRSALDRIAGTPLFMSTMRLAQASPDTSEAMLDTSRPDPARPAKRRALLSADPAVMLSDDVIALSRVSESDAAAVGSPLPAKRATTKREHPQSRATAQRRSTYTTVCVRLCDGAYFPISYATTPRHFAADAAACNARCEQPSRLYVYPTGDTPEGMRDLSGTPYIKLATAFAFQRSAARQCSCRAKPWDEASRERHRIYALEAGASAGDAAAAKELAIRRAVADAREGAPDPALVALGYPGEGEETSGAAPALAFGPPVVAPLDEASIKLPPPPRYTDQLQPLSVVLDATGSPVRRHVSRAEKPAQLKLLAKVEEPAAPLGAAVAAAVAETGSLAVVPAPRPASRSVASDDPDVPNARHAPGVRKVASERRTAHAASIRQAARAIRTAHVQRQGIELLGVPVASDGAARGSDAASAARARRTAGKPAKALASFDAAGARDSKGHARRLARADLEPDWREVLFRPY